MLPPDDDRLAVPPRLRPLGGKLGQAGVVGREFGIVDGGSDVAEQRLRTPVGGRVGTSAA